MRNVYLLPIEPLDERYSAQWYNYFRDAFIKHFGENFFLFDPDTLTNRITNGSFLDVAGTNYYKQRQLEIISKMFFNGDIKDGDIIFLMDMWFPGLESIAYMRDGLGIDVKIVGCIFAGTYDTADFTFQKGMSYWGEDLENSWFKILDKIFVATQFHKKLILQTRKCDPRKLVVTGHPILNEMPKLSPLSPALRKEDIIVFPHRLDPEKRPDLISQINHYYPWRVVKSKEVCTNKREFYNLLQKSKIAISFAEQETFGFAMIESVFADCLPLVPDRLSYSEMYLPEFKYSNLSEFNSKLGFMMYDPARYEKSFAKQKKILTEIGAEALLNMIEELKKL